MTTSFSVKTLIAPDKRQLRTAVWDVPEGVAPRGICLVLQGLTEFLEKYDETARELTARGLIVVSLDWRSQGASERSRSGNRAGHVTSFDEYDSISGRSSSTASSPSRRTGSRSASRRCR